MPRPCRAVPWPWEVALRMAWSWHGTGAAWHVWIKRGRNVSVKWERQNLNAERHGMDAAWERHGMCQLVFRDSLFNRSLFVRLYEGNKSKTSKRSFIKFRIWERHYFLGRYATLHIARTFLWAFTWRIHRVQRGSHQSLRKIFREMSENWMKLKSSVLSDARTVAT
jgi:hypothetical protein